MQQRLLGYQTEAQTFLSTCRQGTCTHTHTQRDTLSEDLHQSRVPVLEEQLATWDELLRLFPSVLIGNLERRHEAELRKGVGGVRAKLARTLSESEKERVRMGDPREEVFSSALSDGSLFILFFSPPGQCDVSCRLRISLRNDKLQDLVNREESRQQQLHSTICSAHLQVQVGWDRRHQDTEPV